MTPEELIKSNEFYDLTEVENYEDWGLLDETRNPRKGSSFFCETVYLFKPTGQMIRSEYIWDDNVGYDSFATYKFVNKIVTTKTVEEVTYEDVKDETLS